MNRLLSLFIIHCSLFAALQAASTASMVGLGNGTYTVAVTTSAVVTIDVTGDSYTIHHTGIQNDASTASTSTDTITVMNAYDKDGTAVSMVATYAAGRKLNIVSGAAWTISGSDVPKDANGIRTIQIKAAGNGAMVEIKREQ